MTIPEDLSVWSAVGWLGNGAKRTSADTVPFTLWCAAGHLESYSEALWAAVSGLGHRDTTCAIVGALVGLSVGRDGIPKDWLAAREPLK
jgi:ADP-ribosylglycohydrolase